METNDYYNKIISLLEKPYFKNLISMGIDEGYYEGIFERIYNQSVNVEYCKGFILIHKYGKRYKDLYCESVDDTSTWFRREYDDNGYVNYYEQSDGYWYKREYNDDGVETYYENSKGEIIRYEYDEDGYLLREDKITIG